MEMPVVAEELAKREEVPPEVPAGPVDADLAVFAVPVGVEIELVPGPGGVTRVRVRKERAEVTIDPAPPVATSVRLTREDVAAFESVTEMEGQRPPDAAVRFTPVLRDRPRRPRSR